MVHVHIWKPTTVALIAELGIMPDLGHASLEIPANGVYASYWPELNSLLGAATYPFKSRTERNPPAFSVETDRADHYMQRPPSMTLTLDGLDVARIARDWPRLSETKYDPSHWNCAGVCKYLLLAAMPSDIRPRVEAALSDSDCSSLNDQGDLLERIASLISSKFASCAPEDVFQLAKTYSELSDGKTVIPSTLSSV